MNGVILEEMRLYVVSEFGEAASIQVLERSGRGPGHQYDPDQAYPDSELGLLAVRAAEVTGKPIPEVLEGFGQAMVPDMFKYYSILVNPRWSFVDFLLGMEPVLHAALQLHTPDAQPTKVHATREGSDTVRVVYDSPLRACAAVRGVIRGAAVHYGVDVNITENECVLRGDPACVFIVEGSKD
jgi:Haem-NO-binding